MPERVVAVIQARQGSSRLPGKAMRVLNARPLVSHVVERVRAVDGLDGVVLATSTRDLDDGLAAHVASLGVPVVRGSERDVLHRVFLAATLARADVVVRVTGDCPLLCPLVAGEVLATYRQLVANLPLARRPYVWNDTTRSGFPDGTDVEVFAYDALADADAHARSTREREHVTPFIREHYPVATVHATVDRSALKLSVDTEADFERVRRVYSRLPPGDLTLSATLAAYGRSLA